MKKDQHADLKPMAEQIVYADLLFKGAWFGIFLMIVTYAIYLSGVLDPHVALKTVVSNWDKGVDEYLHITHSPQGWGWVGLLGTGDFLNYLGLALLALMTIVCYFILMIGYSRRKDWIYCVFSALEILVLLTAASGILGSGGH